MGPISLDPQAPAWHKKKPRLYEPMPTPPRYDYNKEFSESRNKRPQPRVLGVTLHLRVGSELRAQLTRAADAEGSLSHCGARHSLEGRVNSHQAMSIDARGGVAEKLARNSVSARSFRLP
jgi:hypothetical protein